MTISIGVDLAAQSDNTALVVLERHSTGSFHVLEEHAVGKATDADIEGARTRFSAAPLGIDCPFGYPRAFLKLAIDHHFASLDSTGQPSKGQVDDLVYRRTELYIRGREDLTFVNQHDNDQRFAPMSGVAEKLGRAVVRCVHLLARLGVTDRSGSREHGEVTKRNVVEVYPALALGQLGVTGSYKNTNWSSNGEAVEAAFRKAAGIEPGTSATEHAFDALVCAWIAAKWAMGHCEDIHPDHVDHAREEGWIAVLDVVKRERDAST